VSNLKFAEIVSPDTKLFAKSEFGPVHTGWPGLSFSHHKIATDFAAIYQQDRDFVIYVGTGDPEKTEALEHRRALLSIATIEPSSPIRTREMVAVETWERVVQKWGERWEWSLPIITSYDVTGFPQARSPMPLTYRSLGNLPSLGRCVPVQESEYQALYALDLDPPLHLRGRIQTAMDHNAALRVELTRLVNLIKADVAKAGTPRVGVNPPRYNDGEIYVVLMERWREQHGMCDLCERPIPLKPKNKLLQMSRDRTASQNKTYDWENTRLTHLACNLGKSDATIEQWHDYLSLVREEPTPVNIGAKQ
jgi:hypothetical protein